MNFDVIIAGGGLAGSGLAKVLTDDGMKVLVLEKETQFRDRIRGEVLLSWGVVEAQKLGLMHLFDGDYALDIPNMAEYARGEVRFTRDFLTTTPGKVGLRHFHHPEMQEILIQAARDAGADVRRGVQVTGVQPGKPPSVTFVENGTEQTLQARLVVAADGKNSQIRSWAGFELQADPERLVGAGTIYDGLAVENDTFYVSRNPSRGLIGLIAPLPNERIRCFAVYNDHGQRRGLNGDGMHSMFKQVSIESGFPPEWFDNAKPIGILAEFQMHSRWVDHPYRDGVVLLGDAASSPDPTYGEGMSLALRDIRTLRTKLAKFSDWDEAGHTYAAEQNRDFMKLRQTETFFTDWLMETGAEADARRTRVEPRLREIDSEALGLMGSGPEVTFDESVRDFLFAP